MKLDYLLPSPAFEPLVSIFGHVHSLPAAAEETIPALLPNLHIRLAGQSFYQFENGSFHEAPTCALIGATSSAYRIRMSSDFAVLTIGLLPAGWLQFVGLPAAMFADGMIDASLIWPASATGNLWHALAEASSLPERRRLIESFLAERTPTPPRGDPRRVLGVRQWIERPGPLVLDTLAHDLSLSRRQMERVTLDTFGAGPKTLAMKYRALRAAGALAVGDQAGFDAAMADYADQSHLIRDFRRFVGWTPQNFLRERQHLARATLHGRWAAGLRTPMTLLS